MKDKWTIPQSLHVTVLYIGGDSSKKDTDIYKKFKPGVKIDIEIRAVLLVDNRIMAGICFP
jgi:hypothetical protein